MKLLIKKSTKPRRLGTIGFQIYVRLEVTELELDLLNRCNLLNEPLLVANGNDKSDGLLDSIIAASQNKNAKVYDVIEGHTFMCERLDELVELESQLTVSSTNLQSYISIADSFGSEEVLDLEELAQE